MYEESVSLVMDRRLIRAMRDTVYWLYNELASRRQKGFTSESINGFRRFFFNPSACHSPLCSSPCFVFGSDYLGRHESLAHHLRQLEIIRWKMRARRRLLMSDSMTVDPDTFLAGFVLQILLN